MKTAISGALGGCSLWIVVYPADVVITSFRSIVIYNKTTYQNTLDKKSYANWSKGRIF